MQKVLPIYTSCETHPQNRAFLFGKRFLDIVLSFVLLVTLLPLEIAVAVIAAIDTKGSPLFIQTRAGRHNRPFRMLKFRTMSTEAPSDVATHKLHDPDRYLSARGRMLRRLSLDELPQLVNILKGDMSFVGPRPVVLSEMDLLELRTRNGASAVRPGLTGWAQVNGRDEVRIAEKAQLDGYYASHMSPRLDVKVVLRTIGCVLRARGICEGANPAISAGQYRRERSA